jgi:hypothetical protein
MHSALHAISRCYHMHSALHTISRCYHMHSTLHTISRCYHMQSALHTISRCYHMHSALHTISRCYHMHSALHTISTLIPSTVPPLTPPTHNLLHLTQFYCILLGQYCFPPLHTYPLLLNSPLTKQPFSWPLLPCCLAHNSPFPIPYQNSTLALRKEAAIFHQTCYIPIGPHNVTSQELVAVTSTDMRNSSIMIQNFMYVCMYVCIM